MDTFNFLRNKWLSVFVLLVGLLALAACSSDEGVAPDKNHSPVLVFAVDALAVAKNSDATLSVNATDPDGDAVTVNWQVTRNGQPSGTLNPTQQGTPSIAWVTPVTAGRDTITITGTDGKGGTTTLIETIRVGTVKTPPIQGASVTWSANDSPFIIRPTDKKFVIDPTGSLTIQVGSDLLIDKADLEIDVLGTLRSNGTAQAPVVIQPNSRTPESGDWTGLIVTPDGSTPLVQLYHTDILYATDAIFAVGDSEIRLDSCRLKFSSEFGVLFQSSQDLHVMNSAITDNVLSGIRIGGPAVSTRPDSVVISGNSLALNGDISGATSYTDQAAIYIDISDYSRDSAIQILDNEISNNGFPAIHLVRACYPEIRDNAIFSNERGKVGQRYNIRLQNGFGVGGPQDTISAWQNYWGAPYLNPAAADTIKKTIWDSDDAAGIAVRVLVYPWLHAAP